MGQQQLLLVILVTIIVGIATVVAINTFSSAADSANLDAIRQDLGTIAASAQGYYMKPTMMGGGSKTFKNLTFNDITFGGDVTDGQTASNENAIYTIPESITGSDFVVTATSTNSAGTTIQARVCADKVVMGEPNSDSVDACEASTTATETEDPAT